MHQKLLDNCCSPKFTCSMQRRPAILRPRRLQHTDKQLSLLTMMTAKLRVPQLSFCNCNPLVSTNCINKALPQKEMATKLAKYGHNFFICLDKAKKARVPS